LKRSLCQCRVPDEEVKEALMDVAVAKWNRREPPPVIIQIFKVADSLRQTSPVREWSRRKLSYLLDDAYNERIARLKAAPLELVFVRPQYLPPCTRCSQTSLCGCRVDKPVLELVDVLFTRYSHVAEGDLVEPLCVVQAAVKTQPKRKWTREELGRLCDEVVHEALPDAQPYGTAYMPVIKKEDGSFECVPITEEPRKQVDSQDS
jgi:hypothetical protein